MSLKHNAYRNNGKHMQQKLISSQVYVYEPQI